MSKRVLIIGAGPGGLAAGLLLARAGLQVRIVERLPFVGGRTSTFATPQGFRFDLGPTFFLYPPVLEQIYKLLGRDLFAEIEMRRLDPQYRLLFGGGGRIDATPQVERMKQEIARLSPADAEQLERFLADNRTKLARFKRSLETPFLGWRDLFQWHLMKLLPLLRPWASLDGELRRYFGDPRVRLAFSFQSKYLGMSPFRCPSLFSILSFLEYEYGVYHPIGGCGTVSERMAELFREMGGEIRLGEPVEEILFEGRRAVGVRTAADTYQADAVVLNADFARAASRLIPDRLRRRWSDATIPKKKYSCSTFMMYLGIDGRYDDVAHHTIYTAADYERNLDDIEHRHVLSEDPSLYVQNACVTDPSLAPDGMSTLYILAPVTHQHPNVDWRRDAGPFRRRVLQQLEKLGIHDVERRIRYERVLTPAEWDAGYEIYRGATFNLAHNLGQMLHLRPRNRYEDVDGVYLVGGGTHPGSGLPVIFESALISARLLQDDLGLSTAWMDGGAAAPVARELAEVV